MLAALPALPGPDLRDGHVAPYVLASPTSKALHFSIGETQSRMLLHDPTALDLAYTRTMMGFLLFVPEPRSIAMIGLGGGSLAKFCYRYLARTRIHVVEINPHVIALRDEFQVPPDDERLTVELGDGAAFVRRRAPGPDVLMVDGFDSQGLPPDLSSQRFYDDCAALLAPPSIFVANLHAQVDGDRQLRRIRRSFGAGVLVVDDADHSNRIVFACRGSAFHPLPAGLVRRPLQLEDAAGHQLRAAYAQVLRALRHVSR